MNTGNADKIPGIETLWTLSKGDPEFRIAILDGPVVSNHASLQGAKISNVDNGKNPAKVKSFHGTFVASIILGQHGSPVTGIAPQCQGLSITVYDEDDQGNLSSANQTDLASGIRQALESGAHLINISGGETTTDGTAYPMLQEAINACEAKGVLVIAAAGNDGGQLLHVPAVLPQVLAVGSMDMEGNPSNFSNWGQASKNQGILVPGENILGAMVSGDPYATGTLQGTSFATPLVTGAVALLASVQRQQQGRFNLMAIRQAILETSTPCTMDEGINCDRVLTGRINLPKAIEYLRLETHPLSNQPSNFNYFQEITMSNQTAAPLVEGAQVTPSADAAPYPGQLLASGGPGQPTVNHQAAPAPATPASAPASVNPSVMPQMAPQMAAQMAPQMLPQMAPQMAQQASYSGTFAAPTGHVVPSMEPAAAQAVSPQASMQYAPVGTPMNVNPSFQQMMPQANAPMVPTSVNPSQCQSCQTQEGSSVTPSITPSIGDKGQIISFENADLIFALGELSYDFGLEARLDSFKAQMRYWFDHQVSKEDKEKYHYSASPHDHNSMAAFLLYVDPFEKHRPYMPYANALIWTLTVDSAPVYSIRPEGSPFAAMIYQDLALFLRDQVQNQYDPKTNTFGMPDEASASSPDALGPDPVRMSLAGHITGNTRLYNGDTIPGVEPVLRGLHNWTIGAMMNKLYGDQPATTQAGQNTDYRKRLQEFMTRLYTELRNKGRSPEDRALNYCVYNLSQLETVIKQAVDADMLFKSYKVKRSRIARQHSICMDIELTFFSPKALHNIAPRTFAITIDASDIVPIAVGDVHIWDSFPDKTQ